MIISDCSFCGLTNYHLRWCPKVNPETAYAYAVAADSRPLLYKDEDFLRACRVLWNPTASSGHPENQPAFSG